jgi:beta-mannosidase
MDFRKGQPHIDLNGVWSFSYTLDPPSGFISNTAMLHDAGLPEYKATVPGNFELDLQANGIIGDPFFGMNPAALRTYEQAHVWYWRRFTAEERPDCDAMLRLEGVDCYAIIFLNGKLFGQCRNMLIEHEFNVGRRLQSENELFIHIHPAVKIARRRDYPPSLLALASNYDSLYVRKAPHMYGWDIMPRILSAGIWRPVRLMWLPKARLNRVWLETLGISSDRREARLKLHYRANTGAEGGYEIRIEGRCSGSVFSAGAKLLFEAGSMGFTMRDPALWWPRGRGPASLYDIRVSLLKDGAEVDRMTFTHGIRTVELDRTSVTDEKGSGEFCFRINGEKVFVLGTNWVPVDAFHSRDAERIPPILDMAEEIGCNMIRCWGGNVYENDLFYEICDRKGIMVWQDFAMACAVYPQDADFQRALEREARQVIRRLRQHACLVLWAGDNECDMAHAWGGRPRDPNTNVLTREALPRALREEDASRPYLPSSPYMDETAYRAGERYLPENHLWGPRDYYKSKFYVESLCHFASEMGYHGCPSPESLRRFLSPEKLWPYADNEEWLLHATSPIPGVDLYDYRVELMANQVRVLFGEVPDNLEEFAFASQASQAEAVKFFIEMFRAAKWRRTGILWWNLMDGWPQFSDAVVDYYFGRKLAYGFIRRAQAPLLVMLREPQDGAQEIIACNDTRQNLDLLWSVTDMETGAAIASGQSSAAADSVTPLGGIPFDASAQRFYVLEWQSAPGAGRSHYLAGLPPFPLAAYRKWLQGAGLLAM